MINLFSSKNKVKPDLVITMKDITQLKKYLPDGVTEQEENLLSENILTYCRLHPSPIAVYCIYNPDVFKDILTLRNVNHKYDEDFLPNYSVVIRDFGQVLYNEDNSFSFGAYNSVIRYNSFFGNVTGPYFSKDKVYIIAIETTFSIETTKINIDSTKENNIYIYIPRKFK